MKTFLNMSSTNKLLTISHLQSRRDDISVGNKKFQLPKSRRDDIFFNIPSLRDLKVDLAVFSTNILSLRDLNLSNLPYLKYIIISSIFFLSATISGSAQNAKPFATYVGTSPCGNILKPFLGIANEPDCDFTKWTMTLYPQKGNAPALLKLVYRYGVSRPNTSDFMNEKRAEFEGHWTIQKGTKTKPNATVYQVTLHHVDKNLLFVKLSDNAIHLLDSQRSLMIGNASHSYTFNKAKL